MRGFAAIGSFLTIDAQIRRVLKRGVSQSTWPSLQAHYSLSSVGLHAGYLNVRSLRGKLDELKIRLRDSKTIDVLTFFETWLQPNISDDEIQIPGYKSVRYD